MPAIVGLVENRCLLSTNPSAKRRFEMRMITACAALVALAVTSVQAEDGTKQAVTDTAVINSCGGRLFKIFADFGTPQDLSALRGSTPDDDDVLCDFGVF